MKANAGWVASIGVAMALSGCTWPPAKPSDDLGQGWSRADRDLWYEQTQGSRLVPLSWATALEAADGTPFFGPANMAKFRYLPPEKTSRSQLPVGFAIDRQSDERLTFSKLRWKNPQKDREPWLGLNCAACHTAAIEYDGKAIRVDGGPTVADFQSFVTAFDAALRATSVDPSRLDRFARAVLGAADTPDNRRMLGEALGRFIAWETKVAAANQTDLRYGYGRLDAFGHIFNKAVLFSGAPQPRRNPPDAPVSYPFLWNTSQSDVVQWNGMVPNQPLRLLPGGGAFDYGALGRNAGEVTGVFGDIVVRPNAGLGGYKSSVQVERLSELERLLARLRPPVWPEAILGKIDVAKAKEGERLFDRERCADCHAPLAPGDITTKFKASISLLRDEVRPPGTDPWMACNAYLYSMRTGELEGTKRKLVSGTPLAAEEKVSEVLGTLVIGELVGQKPALIKAGLKATFNANPAPRPRPPEAGLVDPALERAQRLEECLAGTEPFIGYKGRPLTGIWATPPYLHNGSVPTLFDLLRAPADRPTSFFMGTRQFDPKKVGYKTEKTAENSFEMQTRARGGPIPGNSNEGHDYRNADLTDPERWAIVEYLKTL